MTRIARIDADLFVEILKICANLRHPRHLRPYSAKTMTFPSS